MEIIFFLSWLYSIVIFLFGAFWGKFRPVVKDEQAVGEDNVWHDKNTDDYLHYLKMECYYVCYRLSYFITDMVVMFNGTFLLFGTQSTYPNHVILIVLATYEFVMVVLGVLFMTVPKYKEKYYSINTAVYALITAAVIGVTVIYFIQGRLSSSNCFHHLWIQT